ncbi:hypothetical protein HID58_060083, partial [Brassica napus]
SVKEEQKSLMVEDETRRGHTNFGGAVRQRSRWTITKNRQLQSGYGGVHEHTWSCGHDKFFCDASALHESSTCSTRRVMDTLTQRKNRTLYELLVRPSNTAFRLTRNAHQF